jgi:hypothetical protein
MAISFGDLSGVVWSAGLSCLALQFESMKVLDGEAKNPSDSYFRKLWKFPLQ